MAFVLKQSDSYRWPLKLRIPTDGGKKEVSTFDIEFKRLSQEKIDQLAKLAKDIELGRVEEDEYDFKKLIGDIVIGWDGVVDDSGEKVPFSQNSLDQLLSIATVPNQILRTLFESLNTEEKPGKRKNF